MSAEDQTKLEKAIEEHGVEVDEDLHEELVSIMEDHQPQMSDPNQHPPDSFQQIFWSQQYQASKVKDSRGIKWEPAMIRLYCF